MPERPRPLLLLLVASLAVIAGSWIFLAASIYALGGVATVRVHDRAEGVRIYLPVPSVVLETGALLCRSAVRGELERHEVREWLPPVRELLRQLDELPEVTLVEVLDGAERVRVRKARGRLLVEVEDRETWVRVSLPTRGLNRIAGRLL